LVTIRRLRRDARGREGGVREELAKGAAMTFETFVLIVVRCCDHLAVAVVDSRAHELTAFAWRITSGDDDGFLGAQQPPRTST
jgi:hypothetical protein